jgi:hypothetical protein
MFTFAFTTFTSGFALFSERRFTTEHTLPEVTEQCRAELHQQVDIQVGEHFSKVFLDGRELAFPRDWTMPDDHTIQLAPAPCQLARAHPATLRAALPWSVREVGYLFMYTGFLGILIQGGLIGRLVKKLGEVKLAILSFAVAAISYTMLGLAETLTILVGAATLSAFGNGVLRPVITSRITQAVGRHEQGVALGLGAPETREGVTQQRRQRHRR